MGARSIPNWLGGWCLACDAQSNHADASCRPSKSRGVAERASPLGQGIGDGSRLHAKAGWNKRSTVREGRLVPSHPFKNRRHFSGAGDTAVRNMSARTEEPGGGRVARSRAPRSAPRRDQRRGKATTSGRAPIPGGPSERDAPQAKTRRGVIRTIHLALEKHRVNAKAS